MPDNATPEQLLTQLDLFASLSGRQVKKLVSLSKQVHHAAGRTIAQEGLGALGLHVIISGTASVSLHDEHVRDLGAGDYFGEISMIDGQPRSASVLASSDLETLVVPHVAFRDLLEQEPDFAIALLSVLCSRLRQAEAR